MSEHPDVPAHVTDAALDASPQLERFYVQGGGTVMDLRTDLSHALAAATHAAGRVINLNLVPFQERRVAQLPYTGPDRRQALVTGASL